MKNNLKGYAAIFDLDGTLIDSFPGIAATYRAVCEKYSLQVPSDHELESFIGPTVRSVLSSHFQIPNQNLDEMTSYFREFYLCNSIFDFMCYPGISEVITTLLASDCSLYIATTKSTLLATKIVHYAEWDGSFKRVLGSSDEMKTFKKSSLLETLLREFAFDVGRAVMIGDKATDVFAAQEVNMKSIGVLWGYSSGDELPAASPDLILSNPVDLPLSITELFKTKI